MPKRPLTNDEIGFLIVWGGVVIVVGLIIYAWWDSAHEASLLMEQCKIDGNPEYVCFHYVYGGR